jgi:polysaccharide transporter, PST family
MRILKGLALSMANIPFIGPQLAGRPKLRKAIANTGWLLADRMIRMVVGLFVVVWMARYLGPQQFGLLNFAVAFTALFGGIATLGLDKIVVRDLVRHPERRDVILGSAFGLKLIGGSLALLITVTAIGFIRSGEPLTLWLVGISAAGFVFQSLNVIDFFFQAQIQSKYTVYAANAAFLLVTLVKVALLLHQAPLIAFAWAGLVEIALASLFLMFAYRFNRLSIRTWRFDRSEAWCQLRDSWPLIFSILAVMIYMRIDQVMIGQMLGDQQVGIYSAAVRISEVWYFIPVAIAGSVFPVVIQTKTQSEMLYGQRVQKLLDMLALMGLSVAIVMTFASSYIVHLLYGVMYAASAEVLALHIWAGVFVCLHVAGSHWFMAENLQKYTFYRTCIGAAVNVALNLYMIPAYGPKGAAISTIVSQGGASVFFNAFNYRTRPIFLRQVRALFLHGIAAKGVSYVRR